MLGQADVFDDQRTGWADLHTLRTEDTSRLVPFADLDGLDRADRIARPARAAR